MAVLESPHLGGHSPILLSIPSDTSDEEKPAGRRLRVGQLSDEDWVDRNRSPGALLARILSEEITGREAGMNVTHYHRLSGGATNRVFVGERRNPVGGVPRIRLSASYWRISSRLWSTDSASEVSIS